MKKYFSYLLRHAFTLLMILIVCFLTSVVSIDVINRNISYYQADFSVENIENFNHELLTDVDFLNKIKDSGYNETTKVNKYENIDVEKMIKKADFTYSINENKITIKTKVKYYDDFFNSSSLSVGSRAKTFIKDSVVSIDKNVIFADEKNIISLKNSINKWRVSFIVLATSFILEIILTIILFIKKISFVKEKYKYDNENLFSSCLNKKYWKLSIKPLVKVKDITTIAMLFALMLVCKFIPIPSGFGNLGLGITYLFFAMVSMIYGPIYGFIIGVFSDIIGFFIDSNGGVFHLGYTMQAALTGFIYGVCLYRRKITFSKVFICRFVVNMFINVVLGSFLYILVFYPNQISDINRFKDLYSSYALLLSLPKNIVWLLPQSILLYYVLKIVSPTLVRFKLIEGEILDKK